MPSIVYVITGKVQNVTHNWRSFTANKLHLKSIKVRIIAVKVAGYAVLSFVALATVANVNAGSVTEALSIISISGAGVAAIVVIAINLFSWFLLLPFLLMSVLFLVGVPASPHASFLSQSHPSLMLLLHTTCTPLEPTAPTRMIYRYSPHTICTHTWPTATASGPHTSSTSCLFVHFSLRAVS